MNTLGSYGCQLLWSRKARDQGEGGSRVYLSKNFCSGSMYFSALKCHFCLLLFVYFNMAHSKQSQQIQLHKTSREILPSETKPEKEALLKTAPTALQQMCCQGSGNLHSHSVATLPSKHITLLRRLFFATPMGSWGALGRVWPVGRGRSSFPSTLP